MIKKRAKTLPSSFEKREKKRGGVLEKIEAKKSLSLTMVLIGDIK